MNLCSSGACRSAPAAAAERLSEAAQSIRRRRRRRRRRRFSAAGLRFEPAGRSAGERRSLSRSARESNTIGERGVELCLVSSLLADSPCVSLWPRPSRSLARPLAELLHQRRLPLICPSRQHTFASRRLSRRRRPSHKSVAAGCGGGAARKRPPPAASLCRPVSTHRPLCRSAGRLVGAPMSAVERLFCRSHS